MAAHRHNAGFIAFTSDGHDSFKKIQHDSPWLIDADFFRAEALSGLGKKEEAKKIWRGIAKDYPKHELAEQAKRMTND